MLAVCCATQDLSHTPTARAFAAAAAAAAAAEDIVTIVIMVTVVIIVRIVIVVSTVTIVIYCYHAFSDGMYIVRSFSDGVPEASLGSNFSSDRPDCLQIAEGQPSRQLA